MLRTYSDVVGAGGADELDVVDESGFEVYSTGFLSVTMFSPSEVKIIVPCRSVR